MKNTIQIKAGSSQFPIKELSIVVSNKSREAQIEYSPRFIKRKLQKLIK